MNLENDRLSELIFTFNLCRFLFFFYFFYFFFYSELIISTFVETLLMAVVNFHRVNSLFSKICPFLFYSCSLLSQ